jgi:thiamine pyrophosphate-dependent acetolactate synthase large subunit-like protein
MSVSEGSTRDGSKRERSAPEAATRTLHVAKADTAAIERPIPSGTNAAGFGSDVVAEALRDLDIPYIALNPGASYRGLHDSLVNHIGNAAPQMLLCLHEEAAVAIAHGYAKVTGKAMAAAVHSNVGLFHATMAIFNAWCDRMPMVVLGATGPVDAAKRRPWIDWIHTAADQGAIVRNYTKWDDQPASPAAARESLLRGSWLANTAPQGPVYINLDADMQESVLEKPLPAIDASRFMPPVAAGAPADLIKQAAALLKGAKHPVILVARVSRDVAAWKARVALAEAIGARVCTTLKVGAAFPTDHPLHVDAPQPFTGDELTPLLKQADVILSLDWVDLAGTLKPLGGPPAGKVIQVSLDHQLHNGWSMDYQGLPPVDLFIAADPDAVTVALAAAIGPASGKSKGEARPLHEPKAGAKDTIGIEDVAHALRGAVGQRDVSLTHLPLSWQGSFWHFRHPLDFLGSDGGGGVGGGPGISVGAALALRGSGRLPIGICGDGDFLMSVTSLWTAVHYRIPLLIVVANNRSFYNDEVHQERMAILRNRPVDNKWIGQKMLDPEIDLAGLARAQGARGFGPIRRTEDLAATFAEAVAAVENGEVAVVDVRIEPGYGARNASTATHRKSG